MAACAGDRRSMRRPEQQGADVPQGAGAVNDMTPRELLTEPVIYLAPGPALDGLDAAIAHRRLPGAGHAIAEIVAHMTFWQEWFSQRCAGTPAPMVQHAAAGWPEVAEGSWPRIQQQFVGGL